MVNGTATDTTYNSIVSWTLLYADDSISGGNTYPASHVSYDGTESGLDSDNAQDAIDEVVANFQAGVDSVYDAIVDKGTTPASHSLADVVQGIEDIETGITPTGTINITSNGTKDVTEYASASVNVPNSNSGTYTPTTRAASIDMGATNSYRYVTTTSVPNSNSTTYTATTRSTKLDLGSTNTYRYLVTSGVPNSNSTTYTYGSGSTGGKVDLGATNSYRYVVATNAYNQGKEDILKSTFLVYETIKSATSTYTVSGAGWYLIICSSTITLSVSYKQAGSSNGYNLGGGFNNSKVYAYRLNASTKITMTSSDGYGYTAIFKIVSG